MRKLLALLLALMCLTSVSVFAETASDTEKAATFSGPYLLTSAGQSADFQMVKTMLKMNKVENFQEDALLTPDKVPEDTGTIIIVIGGSSKGLGAAGIDADQELARLEELIAFAEEKEIDILSMHIGGTARRGELSDKFIGPVIAASKAAIVVEEANIADKLFDTLSEENEVPVTYIQKKSEGAAILKEFLQ